MFTVTVRSLLGHKRRLVGTFTAIILGVAFLAGTLVLSDTMRASFDTIFASANAGTDVVVKSSRQIGDGARAQSGLVPESLIPVLETVPQVQAAAPNIQGFGQIAGSDGKPIGGDGPPTFAGNWIDYQALNPYRIVQGNAPVKNDEIVIDQGAAAKGGLTVGSKTTLYVPNALPVTVVGIATFGTADSLGGTTYAGMTLSQAQRYFASPGQVNEILLQGKPGVTEDQLKAAIAPVLPEGTKAITGSQLTADQTQQIEDGFLGFFRIFLLVFAFIALVVAAFSIYNTFAVVVAQRIRESALLRALGASRGQIVRSMTAEAVAIGVVASALGLAGGIALAYGLRALLEALGTGLPSGAMVVTWGTVAVSMLVGIVVTILASLLPGFKASRVPPLAALRDVAVDRSHISFWRAYVGFLALGSGLFLLALFLIPSSYAVLARAGWGAALVFVGFLILGPVAARPVGRVLGAPIKATRGIAGVMATRNAIRNPRRTANTSAALLVGVCVVTLFTIFAASIKTSIDASVAGSFQGELVMSTSSFNGSGYSPEMIAQFGKTSGVDAVAPLANGAALVNGKQLNVTVSDPKQLGQVIDLPSQGEPVTDLKSNQLAISQETASQRNLGIGSKVLVSFSDGKSVPMTIGSIYEGEELVGNAILPSSVYGQHVRQVPYSTLLIGVAPNASVTDVQQSLQQIADRYGAGSVQTREQFIETTAGQIDQLLGIVYVLLILAIIIALMGIANTLSLSIFERTRELGLLRAVGLTRAQTRSMVRWESVIIAMFGTVGGLGSGILLGWALMQAVAAEEQVARFSLPVGQLVFVAIVGAVVGVIAGWRPAARAAKLNVLQAISVE